MGVDFVEIDDGVIIVRLGTISITVRAETATIYDTEKGIPAKKVSLSDAFWEEASDFLKD